MTKGIYQLQFLNDPHSRIYTGRSCNIEHRYQEHCSDLISGKHHNQKIQAYFDVYQEFPDQVYIEGSYNTSRHEQKVQNSVPRERQWNVCPLVDNPKFKKTDKKKKRNLRYA
jgi:predicted GIY-YIG superfamily endonuclease